MPAVLQRPCQRSADPRSPISPHSSVIREIVSCGRDGELITDKELLLDRPRPPVNLPPSFDSLSLAQDRKAEATGGRRRLAERVSSAFLRLAIARSGQERRKLQDS